MPLEAFLLKLFGVSIFQICVKKCTNMLKHIEAVKWHLPVSRGCKMDSYLTGVWWSVCLDWMLCVCLCEAFNGRIVTVKAFFYNSFCDINPTSLLLLSLQVCRCVCTLWYSKWIFCMLHSLGMDVTKWFNLMPNDWTVLLLSDLNADSFPCLCRFF